MAIDRNFPVVLDLNNTSITNYPNILIVSGDTNVYGFDFTIKEAGNIVDLTPVDHVWIYFKKADGNTVQGVCTITDAVNGKISYELGTQEIAFGGRTYVEIVFFDATDKQLTSSRFQFTVTQSLNNDDVLESSTQYSTIINLINQVEEGETERNLLYQQAEDERDILYGTAEGNRDTLYGNAETARDGLYTTAEGNRDTLYSNAEIARDGLYNTAEDERDGLYAAAETARDGLYNTAENNRDSLYAIAESDRDTDFIDMLDEQKIIFKPAVATFGDIATTYPSPENGWTTQVLTGVEEGNVYRYNGTEWVHISTVSVDLYTALAGEIEEHLDAAMPHKLTNHATGKTYRYGEQISAEGKPQFIYEEVTE